MTQDEMKRRYEKYREMREKESQEEIDTGFDINNLPEKEDYCQSVDGMEIGTATLLYIAVMFFSIIFKDFIYIWIIYSLIYWKFIKNIKKK